MSERTSVYLITGFLGSGKTTLLNRIISRFPRTQKLTLLVNEFGEVGVDGALIEGDDIDMMEISKGSIFCVCVKTDFIKGLYELNTKVKPDVLLIESTGVANPSDLKKDLKLPIFNDRFDFKEQFCIIDAAHFLDAFGAFASIEKQIASSSIFIINKIDMASREVIEEAKSVVRSFHPSPRFYEAAYADVPLGVFFDFDARAAEPVPAGAASLLRVPVMSEQGLDAYLDYLLDSPELEITPPDTLVSAAYQWEGQDMGEVRVLADSLPRAVVRGKGFVEESGTTYIFNYVMGHWTIEEAQIPQERIKHKNIVVFIGPPEAMAAIDEAARSGHWTNRGVYQPYSPA